jgi:hypothetical protein
MVWSFYMENYLLGDYINSKEYRKPDWLIKMEEIKERLAGGQFFIYSTQRWA